MFNAQPTGTLDEGTEAAGWYNIEPSLVSYTLEMILLLCGSD